GDSPDRRRLRSRRGDAAIATGRVTVSDSPQFTRDEMVELVALMRAAWRAMPSGLADSRAASVLELCDVVEQLLAKAGVSVCVWCRYECPKTPEAMFAHVITCEKRLEANDWLTTLAIERGDRLVEALAQIVEAGDEDDEAVAIALRALGLAKEEPTGGPLP